MKLHTIFVCLSNLKFALGSEIESDNQHCLKSSLDGSCEDIVQIETGYIDESLNQLDQEDPVLIEAVKKLVKPPALPDVPYNLTSAIGEGGAGQYNQVRHLAKLFKFQRKGVFIEAGAYDGEEISNTLYLEKKLGWTGLLVEPNPDAFANLVLKGRRAHIFGHCLSTKMTPETVIFDASGLLGGITNNGKRMTKGDEFDQFKFLPKLRINQRMIKIQCFPLYTLLMAIGNPKVDLFSLDIEGAEFQVLKTLPWDKVDIKVLLVEVDHIGKVFEGDLKSFDEFLVSKDYKFHQAIEIDHVYIKHDFVVPA